MSRNGFTLIEVLVAGAIFVTVLAVMYGLYATGLDISATARYQTELQADSRAALSAMVTELRGMTRTSSDNPLANASIPARPGNNSITFYPPDIDPAGDITWAVSEGSEVSFRLDRSQGTVKRHWMSGSERKAAILARNAASLVFEDITMDNTLAMDQVRITLSLAKSTRSGRKVTVTQKALVTLRN